MKILRLLSYLAILFVFASCGFLKPDYLQVISPRQLHEAMQKGDIFLVDVHIPEQKHIAGTDLEVPFNKINENRDQFPKDKSTEIYLYCESGPMGNYAARELYKLGYRNIFNLEGGKVAWDKAGFE